MTRPAERILIDLRKLGVQYRVNGDTIEFRPAAAVPRALIEEMRACKPALLEALRTQQEFVDRNPMAAAAPVLEVDGMASLPHEVRRESGSAGSGLTCPEDINAALSLLDATSIPGDLWFRAAVMLIARQPGADVRADLREAFEHRAAIAEYDGGLTRQEAERLAFRELRLALGVVE